MSILTRGAVDLYALFEWGLTLNLKFLHKSRTELSKKVFV